MKLLQRLLMRLKATLTLDFINSTTLAPRITFTRASSATYFGSDGLLKTSLYNLLTWSNDFTNAAWFAQGATASKSGSNLLVQATGDQVFHNTTLPIGPSTLAFILSGSGTIALFGFNATDSYLGTTHVTLTATPTLYVANFTSTAVNTTVYFGRRDVSDTATTITFGGGGLFEGTYTAAQILAQGGIPLTTTVANGNPRQDYDPATPAGTTGVELVTNGDFSQGTTGWLLTQPTSGSVGAVGNALRVYSADGTVASASQNVLPSIGKSYLITFDLTVVAGTCALFDNISVTYATYTTSGNKSLVITATSSQTLVFKRSAGVTDFTIDNISVKEVTFAPKGLLIEESRVNNFLNSDFAGTNLSTQSVTVTAAPWSVSFTGTGTITFSGAFVGSLVGSGANTRVSTTFTPTAGSLTCTVTGTVKWAQAELGAAASSFIPTAASPVTRAADNASMTGTNFSSWFNATQGTFVAEIYLPQAGSGLFPVIHETTDGTSSNRTQSFIATSASTFTCGVNSSSGGVSQVNISPATTVAYNTIAKAGYAYALNDYAICTAGGTLATDTSAVIPVVDRILFGRNDLGLACLNGHLRNIRFYSTRLPNATLQALTT